MPVCWFCSKVKGKRRCPARGGELICSRCCGTKRRVEIPCPADCPYLHGSHDVKWISETRRKDDARFLAHFLALDTPRADFLLFLHHVVLRAAAFGHGTKGIASLDDPALEEVVEAVKKTVETETKGILYRHQTRSPHLQPFANWMLQLIASRQQIPGAPPASDEDVLDALSAMLRALSHHIAQATESERYFEKVERLFGKTFAEAPGLELPAELGEPPSDLIVAP